MLDTITATKEFKNWAIAPTPTDYTVVAFAPISLAEIGDAALLNRVETKYVISTKTISVVSKPTQ